MSQTTPAPRKTTRNWSIAALLLIVFGSIALLLYRSTHDKPDGQTARETKDLSPSPPPPPQTGKTVAMDADDAPDPDNIGALIGNTALNDAELVRRLSVVILNESSPATSRSEALTHLLNLTTEEDESILFTLASSPKLSEDLGDDLFKDSLNRPLSTQAELSLVFLTRKEESLRKEAREHLVFLLDQDLGDKPEDWRGAVNTAKQRWATPAK